MSDQAAGAAEPSLPTRINTQIEKDVEDALELLEFGVRTGFKSADGTSIPEDIITAIKGAANALAQDPVAGLRAKDGEAWIKFELAYQRLAVLMCPVTADSLRATESVTASWLPWTGSTNDGGEARSPESRASAHRFTRTLWYVTIAFALFIIVGDWGVRRFGPILDGDVPDSSWNTPLQLMEILTPFAYGGLGACAYLLRVAHEYIHRRSFDLRRKPEYMNRILLGVISGGTITLFINQVATDDGETIHLSAAALGFIAGYSTDFLFNTIERLVAAIMPKVGLDTIRQAPAAARPPGDPLNLGMNLKDLLTQYAQATDVNDKALYKSLIDKFRDKM